MLLVSPTGVSGTRVDAHNLRAGRDLHLSQGGLEGSVRFQRAVAQMVLATIIPSSYKHGNRNQVWRNCHDG